MTVTRLTTALALLVVVSACNCGTGGGSNTGPVKGVIVGHVTDALTGAAIASVAIKAQADTMVTAQTDAEGNFALKDMPLGAIAVTFEAPGYVRSVCFAALDEVLPDLNTPERARLEQVMTGHVLALAELMGTFEKPGLG